MTLQGRLLLASLVVLSVWIPAPGGASASDAGQRVDADLHQNIDVDDVLLRVTVSENGTANWRVEYRVRLDDSNTTDAFEELRADIEVNGSTYRDRFATRMRDTVATAENATGREMTARGFAVATDRRQLPQEYGVIVYTFAWDGFASASGERIEAGDALAGLFLDDETTLLFSWPTGYEATTVSPAPTETRERAVVWAGPLNFDTGEPDVVLASAAETTGEPATETATADSPETTAAEPESGDAGLPVALIGGAILFLLALGGFVAARGRGPTAVPEPDSSGATTATSAADGDAGADLLSNEERVLDLLARRDGRVKQQTVVEELDWTEAKTSRVVNRLKEEDRVEVFRLGRENVLALPDEDST